MLCNIIAGILSNWNHIIKYRRYFMDLPFVSVCPSVCPSVRPSLRALTFERFNFFEFCFLHWVHMMNSRFKFENGCRRSCRKVIKVIYRRKTPVTVTLFIVELAVLVPRALLGGAWCCV